MQNDVVGGEVSRNGRYTIFSVYDDPHSLSQVRRSHASARQDLGESLDCHTPTDNISLSDPLVTTPTELSRLTYGKLGGVIGLTICLQCVFN